MGRPRALKTRDVVPSVDISKAGKGKKRVNFDEDEMEVTVETITPQVNVHEENDNEVPEEVKADSYEILRLKEELEASTTFTKNKKRRKAKKEVDESAADQLLDVSVLQSIGQESGETDKANASDKPELEVIKVDDKPFKPNKKMIGKLEISVLGEDTYNPLKSAVLPAAVAEFENKKIHGVERTRYSTFMSQRRPNPAKGFKVKA